MRQIGSTVFWVCTGFAILMVLAGLWNGFEGRSSSILHFCFGAAAAFFLAGAVVWLMAWKAEQRAYDA
ncbi:MAG TPA: hypothetical protein VNW15_00480 [Rhizomicrobium sp.]|jgi:hypothetical protein|nr:hypothetical protein [Rhizomicrobium sp.]